MGIARALHGFGQFFLSLFHVAGMMKQSNDVCLEKASFFSFSLYIVFPSHTWPGLPLELEEG